MCWRPQASVGQWCAPGPLLGGASAPPAPAWAPRLCERPRPGLALRGPRPCVAPSSLRAPRSGQARSRPPCGVCCAARSGCLSLSPHRGSSRRGSPLRSRSPGSVDGGPAWQCASHEGPGRRGGGSAKGRDPWTRGQGPSSARLPSRSNSLTWPPAGRPRPPAQLSFLQAAPQPVPVPPWKGQAPGH